MKAKQNLEKTRVWIVAGDGAHTAGLEVYQTLNLTGKGYSAELGGWEKVKVTKKKQE